MTEASHLKKQRAWGDANGGIDRATGFTQAGGDPSIAIVEGGIAAARAIPVRFQKEGVAGLIERVGPRDVLAEPIEAAF